MRVREPMRMTAPPPRPARNAMPRRAFDFAAPAYLPPLIYVGPQVRAPPVRARGSPVRAQVIYNTHARTGGPRSHTGEPRSRTGMFHKWVRIIALTVHARILPICTTL